MTLFRLKALWAGLGYFLILAGLAFWVRDIPGQPDAFKTTLTQLIKTGEMSDPRYFATATLDVANNGWISSANEWIFNLWPPGFVLLQASIVKIMGREAPVILVLQVLAAALFSVVLVLLFELLIRFVNVRIAFALPLLIFAFPVSRVFLLQPTGISLGESFAIGLFLLGILLAFNSVIRKSPWYAAYAGLCLGLSAYFRSQFEIILLSLTAWGFLLLIATQLINLRKFIEPVFVKSTIKTIGIALLIAHATTLPWRAYHWINQESPQWVFTKDVVFTNSVMTSEFLEKAGGGFVVAGGGNLVCRINISACGDTVNAKNLFIKTFIENPTKWYALKFDVIGEYWFSSVQNWVTVGTKATTIDIVTNAFLLLALVVLAFLLVAKRIRSYGIWLLLIWFNVSLFSAYLLIFTLAHFEARYFYFPKIVGIFMVLIVVCRRLGRCKKNTHDSESKSQLFSNRN